MARIEGVDLPKNKKLEIGLTYIYGIGRSSAQDIVEEVGIDPSTRIKDLTEGEIAELRQIIDDNYMVEGELRREVQANIKRLKDIGCYRGRRHKKGLPVRGQRTRSNARTRKGPRSSV
ncbi:MAG: 30S ribosomal protein S13 [Halanaerobacter sp.]